MKKFLILLILLFSFTLFPALPGSLTFINQLADKQQTTFGDAVEFFSMTIFKRSYNFQLNLKLLNKKGITKGMKYGENTPLTKGMICLMVTRYNNLYDSLFFIMTKAERYAFRVCASHKIVKYDGSEWDPISGEQLIEIMNKAIQMKDRKKK